MGIPAEQAHIEAAEKAKVKAIAEAQAKQELQGISATQADNKPLKN